MQRSVVISFNWKTEKVMHTTFEGENAANQAASWADKGSFLWKDFPESKGWTHFCHWNNEAGIERGEQMMTYLDGKQK